MFYRIYQTEGIILGKRDVAEADRIFSILTAEFGRVDALAQGSRYLKSKLRYNLDLFSYSRFGLVMTKESWRIVDAEELKSLDSIRESSEKLAVASLLAELINRMVRGQEPDNALWGEIKTVFSALEQDERLRNKENLRLFGLLAVLRILSRLGYVEEHKKWLSLPLEEARGKESLMSSTIEKALKESQL